jgi:thiamine-monophosphate kinase
VSQLGEIALLERIARRLPPAGDAEMWYGDDAAAVEAGPGTLLLTTDAMVQDVDFRLEYCSGEDIGWKSVAINASDIAAMGGRPTRAVVTLTLPPNASVSLVDDLVTGMIAAAQRWEIDLVGGDLGEGREIALSMAVLGSPAGGGPVLRSGANPGEAICVTGSLGGAAGGLVVLERGLTRDDAAAQSLVARQLRPMARVEEGNRLAAAGVSAMIDLSDGLAVDLGHLTDSSSVGCRIDQQAIPVDPHLAWLCEQLHGELDPFTTAVTGGEDFELLFTIAPELVGPARRALEDLGTGVSCIGVTTESGCALGEQDLSHWRRRGWQHLLNR